jgi:hypothetical protein
MQYAAIHNNKQSVHYANNTNVLLTRANNDMPLFRGLAVSSHGCRNRRQFAEISNIGRARKHTQSNNNLIV